ncbi:hypothetical protein [Alteribacillus bidgolensis]|uniref:Uncharacterized protein n=1 Tax=Alteribacillus bidgolensis TaxID=930129 RepID=A0A1G8S4U1_9BACI|nr:hypothetical protein [Alteribacillus bidgolensis]SDJ24226.1 hypothetical protein SAMN05216352_1422 [Alteribacillus bidgolensis]
MNRNNKYEILLWSVAFPGFGQILNRKFFKGFLFITLEFLINVQSNFNKVILLSIHGEIEKAIQQANYRWLMFYPCLYFFAVWDAYKDVGGGKSLFAFLPFAFASYSVTVGLIFSPTFKMMGILFGPVWLPTLSVIPGVVIGLLIKKLKNQCSS